ncbi:MAG TPA: SBBP repeat-containing protein [Bryobacteraceae bacterium]|nr:SBBP repeat-containing protein [Bryobacteraceae bacterium]
MTFERRAMETGGQRFVAHVSGHRVAFGYSGAVFESPGPGGNRPEPVLRFAGARPHTLPQAAGPQAGSANYFLGPHPEQWRTGVPLFRQIKYPGLYPGIDLIFYGNQNRLEYDLVVASGASWRAVRLAFSSAEDVQIDGHGALRLRTGSGWITQAQPVIYQQAGAGRRRISGHYAVTGVNEVGFEIGPYDPGLPLIIDPTLAFASYLGGSGDDYGHAVAIDGQGCAYVVGETGSADFPMLNPEQASRSGASDVFVTKWNASGTSLVYATYIGGGSRDVGLGVALDAAGNAYVTGFTYSADFPLTQGVLRGNFAGISKAFVLKLNPSGNALIYSTFLGGSGDDYAAGIAVDPAGEAHIAGYTSSMDFPATAGAFQPTYGGGSYDGFMAKLNPAGSALVYATYLGGIANDTAAAIALDPSGNIYVTGQTQSSNFPTLNPVQPVNSESDAFVVKMNAAGRVAYATFLGGTGLNSGTAIAADAAGNAYVTGFTDASDFPVTYGAYQINNSSSYDVFVAVLNPSGSSILSATYLGGSGSDIGYGIALDGSGNVFVAGSTNSIDFPVYAPMSSGYQGNGDAFVASFNNGLTSLLYSAYFGGSGSDVAAGAAVDSTGNAFITGWTSSGTSSVGLPVTPGAFQPMGLGGLDAFLAKIASLADPPQSPAANTSMPAAVTSSTATLTGSVNPNGADTQIYFSYSTNSSMNGSISTPRQDAGAGTGTLPVNAGITGLIPNTTYYFQARASNSAGSAQGGVMSFTTASLAAVAVTLTSSPSGASITLAGTGCAPGSYTTSADVTWSAGIACTISFTDPQSIGGVEYQFQSSTVNGSAVTHANPIILDPAGGALSINAVFTAVNGTGTTTHFSVMAPSTATAGIPLSFTVTALDASNRTVTTYSDPVHFTSTDPSAVLPGDALLSKGVGTFSSSLVTVGTATLTAGDLLSSGINGTSGAIAVSQSAAGLRFISMPPCRVVDTRDATKPSGFGPPSMAGATSRSFPFPEGPCGIPATAQAYSLNVTVVPHVGLGYLTIWPAGQSEPVVSTLNSLDGRIKANAAIVPAGSQGAISVFATNATDVVLDINGYFVPATDSGALAFFPMPPCRLADTRPGAPSTIITGILAAGSITTLPVLSGNCHVPPAAQAYSLNFTLVPPGPVAYLTVYPTGENRPTTSALNDLTGTIVADAAIAPAGSGGSLDVFVTQTTDLVVDINGYFAPAAAGGLSLYSLPPCRVLDTRTPQGTPPFAGAMNVNVEASGCGGTAAAQAYVFNATVVPAASLGYLTLWPEGSAQPLASTLNALDAAITSNMAIVPTNDTNNTEVSAFAANNTYLILDVFGYFAP